MTNSPSYPCYVGARGWEHEDWLGSFYPQDLPSDWRLTYYNNFFTCCYLDYAAWAEQTEATLKQWVVDTLPGFRFVLEIPVSLSDADRARLEILLPRTGLTGTAAVLQTSCMWLSEKPNWRTLAAQIQERVQASGTECYLISETQVVTDLQQSTALLEILGY